MVEARVEHTLNCTVDRFWKVYFDDSFNQRLFFGELKFAAFEVLKHEDSEDTLHRVVRVAPRVTGLPTPVQKVIGDGLAYEEDGTFDKQAKTFTIKVRPDRLANKFEMSGVLYCLPAEQTRVKRVFECSIRVKLLGVGGMIERQIVNDLRRDYDTAARFMNEYLAEHELT